MASAEYEEICALEFGVFRPEELLRLAAAKITVPATHSNSLPAPHGPNDFRLGTTDRRLRCGTCQRNCTECYGHIGAIQLSFPVYSIGFFDLTLKLLKITCFYCGSLLLNDSQRKQLKLFVCKDKRKKLAFAVALTKNKRICHVCGGCNPIYTKHCLTIKADFSKANFADEDEEAYCSRPFTSSEARIILQNLSDEDCAFLGWNPGESRPENFILTVFCVIPPIVRPSVVISEGSKSRGHDDLTSKLCDIVKCNNNLKHILDKEALSIPNVGLSLAAQAAVNELTFQIASFMNNDVRGQKLSFQRSGMPTKSIVSRLKGKEGRIRGTLMGKRTDYSARSVISPDPNMDIDEVGVPVRVAKQLTLPIHVVDYNIDYLREKIKKGSELFQKDSSKSIVAY